jgi:hypothetical protein
VVVAAVVVVVVAARVVAAAVAEGAVDVVATPAPPVGVVDV